MNGIRPMKLREDGRISRQHCGRLGHKQVWESFMKGRQTLQAKLRGLSPPANYTGRATKSAKLAPPFTDRRCRVVSVMDPYIRILDFLDRSRYFFFQVAPQLHLRG
jgi:hypothetical protein